MAFPSESPLFLKEKVDNENNSLIALDKILKIKNTTIDQLTSEQNKKLAKYLEYFSDHIQTLFRSITPINHTKWLCYFTYIHHSRYHKSRDSYHVVCLNKDFSEILEDCIDCPNKLKIYEILSEEDKKFHEERLKKPRHDGYC